MIFPLSIVSSSIIFSNSNLYAQGLENEEDEDYVSNNIRRDWPILGRKRKIPDGNLHKQMKRSEMVRMR